VGSSVLRLGLVLVAVVGGGCGSPSDTPGCSAPEPTQAAPMTGRKGYEIGLSAEEL
jgi:hypothetical protein